MAENEGWREQGVCVRGLCDQEWGTTEDPDATLKDSVTAFAGEYLIAHHGIEALFTWLSGSATIEQTFGLSEAELFATLSTYVQAQFEGAK